MAVLRGGEVLLPASNGKGLHDCVPQIRLPHRFRQQRFRAQMTRALLAFVPGLRRKHDHRRNMPIWIFLNAGSDLVAVHPC